MLTTNEEGKRRERGGTWQPISLSCVCIEPADYNIFSVQLTHGDITQFVQDG